MTNIKRSVKDTEISFSYVSLVTQQKVDCFEIDMAVALLLINEVLFLSQIFQGEEVTGEANPALERVALVVNCNDVFAWGCADGEYITHDEIEDLYNMWRKDTAWGPAVWCCKRRKEMPQKPVEDEIRKAGIWNLDELGLEKNRMNDYVRAAIAKASIELKGKGEA